MKRVLLLMLLILTLILPMAAYGGSKTVTFQWDYPSPPTDMGGFYLYSASVAGGPYTKVTSISWVTGTTQYTSAQAITAPDAVETKMYFVVSAYDKNGNESGKSNEVSYIFDFLAPGSPINFIIKVVTSP